MYTIFTEKDGRIEFSLQVPPEELASVDARALLVALEPLMSSLRARTDAAGERRRPRTEGRPSRRLRPRGGRESIPSMRPGFDR